MKPAGGVETKARIPIISNGDYSYGLYVFAFPIQQLFAHWFPWETKWYWNAGFTLLLGSAYAAFSWHLVENPVLKRKKAILIWVDGAMTWLKRNVGEPLMLPIRGLMPRKDKANAKPIAIRTAANPQA